MEGSRFPDSYAGCRALAFGLAWSSVLQYRLSGRYLFGLALADVAVQDQNGQGQLHPMRKMFGGVQIIVHQHQGNEGGFFPLCGLL